jgi:hypothetical protein
MTSHDQHDRDLRRLLGPSGYEIGCDDCFDLIDEFVELELAGMDAEARIPGMRAHLDGCSACRGEHDSLYALAAGETPSS